MKTANFVKRLCPLLIVSLMIIQPAFGQQVSIHPDENRAFSERVLWAQDEARNETDGYWIGYSISKLMHKNAWMGRFGRNKENRRSLYAFVGKPNLEEELPAELRKNIGISMDGVIHIGETGDKKEMFFKEIGVLLYYVPGQKHPSDITMSNMSLPVDLKDQPLYWLGKSSDAESCQYLQSIFNASEDQEIREDVLRSIATHDNREDNFEFLAGVLQSDDTEDIREEAAFWIGQIDIPQGLALLQKTIATDRSEDVREKAVFGIAHMSSDEALNVLIDLAKNAEDRKVKKQAIFWLGQQVSKNVADVLEEVAFDEDDTRVQEQAVFALSQMPADRSLPKLIDIAKNHPNLSVRKKAIFWLGDSGDPRAVNVLIELAQGSMN